MSRILPQLLTFLTGQRRQKVTPGVDFQWSHNSWTHNVFRVWEIIFWRREGIRAEMTADSNGLVICHSWESVFALMETYARDFIASWTFVPFKIIRAPMLATPDGTPVFLSPYLFAIAFDSTANTGDTYSSVFTVTYSLTCTGSNRLMYHGVGRPVADVNTGVTYNSAAATLVNKKSDDGGSGGRYGYLWYQVAPSTGANNVVVTFSANDEVIGGVSTSLSGCKQTAQPDAAPTPTSGTSTSPSISVTTIADNAWVVVAIPSEGAFSAQSYTQRGQTWQTSVGDTNGPKTPAGSQTMSATIASARWGCIAASFAPATSASYTSTLTETVTLSDVLIKTPTRFLTESVTNTATLLKTATRALVEAFTSTDTFTFLKSKASTLTEAVTYTDTIIRGVVRTLSESVTYTAALLKSSGRLLSEAFTSTDTLIRTTTRPLIESVTYTDIFAALKSLARTLTETATTTASLLNTAGRTLLESFSASDVFARVVGAGRVFTESVSFSSTIRILRNGSATMWRNAQKHAATLTNAVRHATTWRNKDRA